MILCVEWMSDGRVRLQTKDKSVSVETVGSMQLLTLMKRRKRVFVYADWDGPHGERLKIDGEAPRSLGWGFRKNRRYYLPPSRKQFR